MSLWVGVGLRDSLTDQTECVTEAEIPEMTSRRQLASRGSCDSSNGKRQSTSTK